MLGVMVTFIYIYLQLNRAPIQPQSNPKGGAELTPGLVKKGSAVVAPPSHWLPMISLS